MTIKNTLDISEAASTNWDVLIIGAGPAGALAALQLGKAGLKTLLIDRKSFPRYKVCGGCLNERTLSVVEQAGLMPLLKDAGAIPIQELQINSPRREVSVPLPHGVAFSRTRFDEILVTEAITKGTEFLSEVTARLEELTPLGDQRRVELQSTDRKTVIATARIVLVADGLANSSLKKYPQHKSLSTTASRLGLGGILMEPPTGYDAGSIHMAVSPAGYVGLTQLEDGSLNLAAALNAPVLKQANSTSGLIQQIIQEAHLPEINNLDSVDWSGTIALTRTTTVKALPRTLRCGDAAGYVEPFTGEGIASALCSGYLASTLVASRIDSWGTADEEEWSRLHRTEVQQRYQYCRWIARLSRYPRAVELALSTINWFPGLTRPIIKHLNEPLAPVLVDAPS
ncbi:Putative oxidoreductase [Polystyrenella longa]|uniref:Oxidoreductase n=1 Tax=Polystyrenella longa TaxID=2528007 RepID=A0A518CH98_9PLAN|nr:NAD(P)/FAD-dependent oxidoreductase [Polystyrenella longa]QDU78601.1 Putative oxidoreductase [Polystyrenella longa]